MLKPLNRTNGQPFYLQIHRQIRQLILAGDLPVGTRLPSERELADLLNINRTTVSKAYQELFADGLVEGQVGRGTIVCAIPTEVGATQPLPWFSYFADIGRQSQNPLHDLFVLSDQENFISFAHGVPDPTKHPVENFTQATLRVLKQRGAEAFQFDTYKSVDAFLETLVQLVARQGIQAGPENIMVLTGAQQGLDLLARAFIMPGDTVVVESPAYVGALGAFREAGASFIEIPVDEAGLRVDILERVLRRHTPRLIYTMPTYQNPSGTVMSMERRQAILALAQRYHIPIIEDDPYSQFYYKKAPPPPLKSMDKGGHVIYLSTFSNTVFPGMRLGWMVAARPVIQHLETIKQFADVYTNSIFQWVMTEFIQQGWFDDHLAYIRPIYARRCQTMLNTLSQHICSGLQWHKPEGGFYVWCWLEEHFRAKDLLTEARQHGVFFVTGEVFHANRGGQETFRLNFTYPAERTIRTGIQRLGQALNCFLK